jgi:uncharacterized protein Yka (UPF0111/DUF47 family)
MAQESKEPQEAKDFFTRLAEVGEDAIHKIAELPAASKLTDSVNSLRDTVNAQRTRVDDLSKKVRGVEALERRVDELERRLDEVGGKKPAPKKRTTKATAAKADDKPSSASS